MTLLAIKLFLKAVKLNDEITLLIGNRKFRLPVSLKHTGFNIAKCLICYEVFEVIV